MKMNRDDRDRMNADVLKEVTGNSSDSRFPLNQAVTVLKQKNRDQSAEFIASKDAMLSGLLDLFEATSISSTVAIKLLGGVSSDNSGIRDLLVDLWTRAEAGRSLIFDAQNVFEGEEKRDRIADICETARVLAPEAIAVAMQLSVPVEQYIEFAEGVLALTKGTPAVT
jgi:hypothetical protein